MSLVPSNWPLNMMSSFLARSLRRTMHAQLEKNIIKNLSAGLNFEYVMIPSSSVPSPLSSFSNPVFFFYIKDWTWEDIRDADLFFEEEVSDNEDTEEEKALEPQSFDEKKAFAKEFAAHLSPAKLVVTNLNEGVAIGTGRRGDTSVDDDHFEQGGN